MRRETLEMEQDNDRKTEFSAMLQEHKTEALFLAAGLALLVIVALAQSLPSLTRASISADAFADALADGRIESVTYNTADQTVHGKMFVSDGNTISYQASVTDDWYAEKAAPLVQKSESIFYTQTALPEQGLNGVGGALLMCALMCFLLAYLCWESNHMPLDDSYRDEKRAHPNRRRSVRSNFGTKSRVNAVAGGKRTLFKFKTDETAASNVAAADKVMFKDIAGIDEALAEVMEIEEFLSNPEKFRRLGAKTPHGIMLAGEPGCGKTMMAKALANESGAAFFSVSGSDFMELYVGVGASRVRELFQEARASAPAILFIDEIDSVGQKRGGGIAGGDSHGERDQTLNQILTEMDGFSSSEDVIVVAATNRIDMLDEALLRPGRFDRHITVDKPDKKGRIDILKVHARGKPVSSGVDFQHYGTITAGMSGADLANLMNEAAIFAARRNADEIDETDMNNAFERIVAGAEKTRVLSEDEKKTTAYHEAGHAVVGYVLPGADKVTKISIVSRGQALGYTLTLPENDAFLKTREELENKMAMMLGGYVAEELVNAGDTSTGPSNDLERVTAIAYAMVTRYGMDASLGYRCFSKNWDSGANYGTEKERQIDEAVDALVKRAHDRARVVIEHNYDAFDALACALIDHEVVEGAEMEGILESCAA